MQLKSIMLLAATMALGATATATVVVDASGATAGSVPTITQALATADTDILVKAGTYEESFFVQRTVTIRGEDAANRPIIKLTGLPAQPKFDSGDGIWVGGTTGGTGDQIIALKNLVLIPASTAFNGHAISGTPNVNGLLDLTLENILIAPNNGSGQPLATSVWEDPDFAAPGVARVPWGGLWLLTEVAGLDGTDGDIKGNFKDVTIIGTLNDAFVVWAGDNGRSTMNFSGIRTSYCKRGAQLGPEIPFTITGTSEDPSWIARKNISTGIHQFQGSTVSIDNAIIVDNGAFGTAVDADTVNAYAMTDCLIANNGAEGFFSNFPAAAVKNWTIKNTTLYNNGRNRTDLANVKFEAQVTNNVTLTITDSIIAGSGSTGFENLGAGTIVADRSGIVTNGDDALLAVLRATEANDGPVVITNQVNADPDFASVATNPLVPESFDVQNFAAYATASSTGGKLNGWGEGPNAASVSAWSMY